MRPSRSGRLDSRAFRARRGLDDRGLHSRYPPPAAIFWTSCRRLWIVHAIRPSDPSCAGSDLLGPGERLPVAVGDVVGGRYRIDRMLGIGGMGVVVSATHTELGHGLALKIMRASGMSRESIDRFLTEGRAAASLTSAHVAKVLDVGTLPSGLPYMVMELLEGSDLSSILETEGSLSCGIAIDCILQACDAISEAHALGIVHRDLKPENLFVTPRRDGTPHVKVLDFGISKNTAPLQATAPDSRRAITHENTVMGSPMYMSPEQVRSSKDVDGRTDIWALGAILFEMVAGESPFFADTVPDIFVRVLEKPPSQLSMFLRDAPAGLADIINRCLEKDRDKRFESVDELAAALTNLGVTPSVPRLPSHDRFGSQPLGLPSAKRVTAKTFVLPGRKPRGRSTLVFVLATIVVAASGIGAVAFYRAKPRATSSSSRVPVTTAAAAETPPAVAPAPAHTGVDPAAAAAAAAASATPAASVPAPVTTDVAGPTSKATTTSKPSARPGGARPRPAPAAAPVVDTHPPAPKPAPALAASGKLERTDW